MKPLHENRYLRDILAQPNALQATLNALSSAPPDLGQIPAQLADGDLRRVVLTGMGSSLYAPYPLMLTLIGRGIPAQLIEAAELAHYAPQLLTPDTLLIIVSQSGRSAEVLRVLERAHGTSPIIAVTNTPESPLALEADSVVLTQAGVEHSVSCKTYVTALAALTWLGNALVQLSPHATLDALRSALAPMEGYLAHWQAHIAQLTDLLTPVRHLTFVGRGPSLAAVRTAGLIVKEAARFPTEGMSSASFRHGPIEMVTPAHFVVVHAGLPITAALNRRLAEDVQRVGGRAAVVEEGTATEVFTLPPVPPVALPLLEILPAQMISLALARLRGHEAGTFTHAHKVTEEE